MDDKSACLQQAKINEGCVVLLKASGLLWIIASTTDFLQGKKLARDLLKPDVPRDLVS